MNSKIVTIHQPEAFPWLGFFHKMSQADCYVFLDNVQFRKNYFQNRNQFLTNNGTIYLSIPLSLSDTKLIKEARIKNELPWKKQHLDTIYHSYSKTSYFSQHYSFLVEHYNKEIEYLVDFNIPIINYIKDFLGIKAELLRASELKVDGRSSDLLLSICKELGASAYLSGRDGRNYLDLKLFEEANIDVVFQEFTHPSYQQYKRSEFVPCMSTFDLLFNHSKNDCINIIKQGSQPNVRV